MRSIRLGFGAAFILCMVATVAWALGADHGPGPVGPNDGGWPEEFREIFNRKDRVHGYFVNSGDVFFYAGDTKAFNGFLKECSNLKDADHELILHPGKARVRSPWDKEDRDIGAEWRLYADRRPKTPGKKYLVQVDLWLGGRASLEDLKVPDNFTVHPIEESEKQETEEKEGGQESGRDSVAPRAGGEGWFCPEDLSLIVQRPEWMEWGPESKGLQLGAWLDTEDQTIYCIIRNATDRDVDIPSDQVGYWQLASLHFRESSSADWRVLARKNTDQWAVKGWWERGPETIPAGQEHLRCFLRSRMRGVGGFTRKEGKPPNSYTFALDLQDYELPGENTAPLDVRVSHGLEDLGKGAWSGTLVSNVLTCEPGMGKDEGGSQD